MEIFIDREVEREIFHRMLAFENDARLLTFKDKAGRGKSFLLKRLQYECNIIKNIPASLILLDGNIDTGFHLVKAIREDLRNFGELEFKKFDVLDTVRILRDPTPFTDSLSGGYEIINAEIKNQTIVAAQIDKIIRNIDLLILKQRNEWPNEKYEEFMRQCCIAAFFEDLKVICQKKPIVILLDAWERCWESLQHWIWRSMLYELCFNVSERPAKLIFVLAGREIPPFKEMLHDRYSSLVVNRDKLSEWSIEHMKEFLKIHGYESRDDETISILEQRVNQEISLDWFLTFARMLITERNIRMNIENLNEPIDRTKELNKFQTILDEKRPVLVTVSGEHGIGKSTFLHMVAELARQQIWNVPTLEFSIGPDTTLKDFEQSLNKQLESFKQDSRDKISVLEQNPQKLIQTSSEEVVNRELDFKQKNLLSQILELISKQEHGVIESGKSILPERKLLSPKKEKDNEILQKLKQNSPILLRIDGYQPGPQFASWFTSDFIAGFKNSEASIIVVVADHPSAIASLAKLTDHKIQLREISRSEVEQHFKRLNTYLESPINSEEAQIYTDEIVKRPYLIKSLNRLLLMPMSK